MRGLSENNDKNRRNEDGSAMVIALLIMILLMGFVALAISRTTTETIASGNDAAESRTFDACHASLELMTKNFSKVFQTKFNVDPADIARIKSQSPSDFPEFAQYDFRLQDIKTTSDPESVILTEGQFQGLTALRDEWEFISPCVDTRTGVTVELQRRFFNNRIPIFQFGIFYDDDLEFHPGPRFDFGGRVHSNGHMFLAAQTGLYFTSKVTARKHIFSDVQKNGQPATNWGDKVYIKNASGVFQQLTYPRGSALQNPVNGAPVATNPWPTAYRNANWASQHLSLFSGNLLAEQRPLDLPLKINRVISGQPPVDLRELVKRGKSVGDMWNDGTGTVTAPNNVPVTAANEDDLVTKSERYYNKTGIRISLADSKQKLPGCAGVSALPTDRCGVRLDGDENGLISGPVVGPRGYWPKAMSGTPAYQATRLNGERFHIPGREAWIKVETVIFNATTQGYDTVDITEDILSLGVTERAPAGLITDTNFGNADSRSVIKLQRFVIPGAAIPKSHTFTPPNDYITTVGTDNYVVAGRVPNVPATNVCSTASGSGLRNQGDSLQNGFTADDRVHWKNASVGGDGSTFGCIVPFPINMFDTREGLYFEPTAAPYTSYPVSNYLSGSVYKVPWAGVMSMVDIDLGNLREFLMGDTSSTDGYDGGVGLPGMPTTTPFALAAGRPLRSTDIPQPNNTVPKSGGWVLYVSDRRGDYDFDGLYDMEDIYGENNGTPEPGEDVNNNGILEAAYSTGAAGTCSLCEAVRYTGAGNSESPDIAAVFDHKYYRRGVRLVNGQRLPGKFDPVTPKKTQGFTVASENAVYVQGNYNATHVINSAGLSQPADYRPQNDEFHIPASIAADAVIVLSNNWRDGRSFAYPFSLNDRPASQTTMRFAMLAGDAMTSLLATPNQGGGDQRMNGGVHNFKRFLETWSGNRLNYAGSLINLFNSQNNNGAFKCCNVIYRPPQRNWVFDTTFLDIDRIPPGTPFFQSIQITGFQRVN